MKKIFSFLVLSSLVFTLQVWGANEALLAEIVQKSEASGSDSLVIVQNGQTIYSDFASGADQVLNVQSVTKSICSLTIGILIDEGRIPSFDTPMSRWFPEWAADAEKSKITLRMIMNHTSGISDKSVENIFATPNYVETARQVPLTHTPGERFEYSNVGISLLHRVIAESAGMGLQDYVRLKIYRPLGIQNDVWIRDSAGQEGTSGGAGLSTADLLKLGYLVLNEGRFNGNQIIQKSTLKTLLRKSQDQENYSLLWWLQKGSTAHDSPAVQVFTAWGWGGQFIVIKPSKRLIGVRTKSPFEIDLGQFQLQEFAQFPELIARWE